MTATKQMGVTGSSGAVCRQVSAVVTRCGCGNPNSHNGVDGPAGVCPRPRQVEDLGAIAFWHQNPLYRVAWRFGRWLRRINEMKVRLSHAGI